MSQKEAEQRATLPTGTLSLLAEMLVGGLDLMSALELIDHGWKHESASASRLARGAASVDRILTSDAEGRRRGAWRELIDCVMRGDAFVESLYALFVLPDGMKARLSAAEGSGALGRVLTVFGGDGIAGRERLVRNAHIMDGFFDFILKDALIGHASRLVFTRSADQIDAAFFGHDHPEFDLDRCWPLEGPKLRTEWDRIVRRARIVLKVGERARQDWPHAHAEAIYPLDDEQRVRMRCDPISSLSTDEWALDFSFASIDEGEEDREMDWLIYG